MFRISNDAAKIIELFLHQKARGGGLHKFRYARGGSMRAMRGAKRVVHIRIAERCELAREIIVVPFLFRMETEILEQKDLAILQRRDFLFGRRPDAIVRQSY